MIFEGWLIAPISPDGTPDWESVGVAVSAGALVAGSLVAIVRLTASGRNPAENGMQTLTDSAMQSATFYRLEADELRARVEAAEDEARRHQVALTAAYELIEHLQKKDH